jgi:hypothetical protein
MVQEPGCKKRPKPLTCEHSHESDEAEEWRRWRWQLYQAKNNTDGKTGTKCEHDRARRNGLTTHAGSFAAAPPRARSSLGISKAAVDALVVVNILLGAKLAYEKQYESDDASPPCRRIWWTRYSGSNSTKNF